MSFVIKKMVIYGHHAQMREVQFREHGLNIITGRSKTGKSAIIDIIDYCLGRGTFNVAEGFIRERVSWFGLLLAKDGDEVFVARDNPGPTANTGSKVYLRRGTFDDYPSLEELEKNTTEDSLKSFMTKYAGIEENEHRPISGTRDVLEANISHALLMCFQKQGTIANQDYLFHRMNEDYLPQAMKDTLPFFLGVVGEDHFRHLAELDRLRERQRLLEREEAGRIRAIDAGRSRVVQIVGDGKRVGLIPQDFQPVDDRVFPYLREILTREIGAPEIIPDFGATIESLLGEQATLQKRLHDLTQDIRATEAFLADQSEFSSEAREQHSRLSSLGLFRADDGGAKMCPLCQSPLTTRVPAVEDMMKSLARVDAQLTAVRSDSPHLLEHISTLQSQIDESADALRLVQANLRRAIAEDENARASQNQLIAQARFIGRLSNFLETSGAIDTEEDRSAELAELRKAIAAVRDKINSDDIASRLQTCLDYISTKMTEYSDHLSLEYQGSQLRLDLRKLTMVANTENGPIPLQRMGSGENWVGYHVLTLLALHWWLRRKMRPVPGFLVFDQPTQTYYPAEVVDGSLAGFREDEDRIAVQRLFELMQFACSEIAPTFQLIVLDHANLQVDWFQNSIIEEWRGDNALVPYDWPSSQ
ncbi:hypothetical protein DEM26_14510 [Thioclava sp. NG1]|uniref:DUF3732 domain-containing protein n=1 Tax=Thioclava sp. NG1 TaxID=2182426 RepID=UPI000D60B6FA|nr:DUF3732 domain-containing protein [Thioclava sp. NG1]PWE49070.1 hypothetical protein DEM26_14510 [Thioclava sp. NG1]